MKTVNYLITSARAFKTGVLEDGVLCVSCHDLLRTVILLSFSMRSWKEEQPQDSALFSPILHKAQVGTQFGVNLTISSATSARRSSNRLVELSTGQAHGRTVGTVPTDASRFAPFRFRHFLHYSRDC